MAVAGCVAAAAADAADDGAACSAVDDAFDGPVAAVVQTGAKLDISDLVWLALAGRV